MSYVKLQKQELKRAYESDRGQCLTALEAGVADGSLRLGHGGTKLHDIFEAFLQGRSIEELPTRRTKLEAVDFVGLADFAIAAGLFLLEEANRGYKTPGFIAEQLCRKKEAASLKLPQKVPYFPVPIDDNTYTKEEGKPYNTIGAPVGYVETSPPKDRGFIIQGTRELLRDDKTGGGIAENIYRQGQGLGIAREKDFLKSIFGTQGSWKFGNMDAMPTTSYNTYATASAPYVNSISNTLSSWKSIDTALQSFFTMTDPVTGQVMGPPTNLTMVVPYALFMKAQNILNATDVMEVDNTVASATVRASFVNPISKLPENITIKLLTNQWVYQVTSSNTTWYLGDFQEAFVLNNGWDEEQLEQGSESNAYFEANILYRQRFSYNQAVYAYAPFRALKNT